MGGCRSQYGFRYLNDVTVIWKPTDKLTLTTDMNYIRDDGFNATGYGVAQYATYAINDWLKITWTRRDLARQTTVSLSPLSRVTWTLSGSNMAIHLPLRSAAERRPTVR